MRSLSPIESSEAFSKSSLRSESAHPGVGRYSSRARHRPHRTQPPLVELAAHQVLLAILAALQLWADMSMNAFIARIVSFHITHAGIGPAQCARPVHAIVGWRNVRKKYCQFRTSKSLYIAARIGHRWPIRTKRVIYDLLFKTVQRL